MKKILVLLLAVIPNLLFGQSSIIRTNFSGSRFYPGTDREIIVSVPPAYASGQKCCMLVCMDGILFDAVNVMDGLTSEGKMPPTIGVFIGPGVIKNARGEVVRYNRSNEFDRVDGRFASFLEKEIFPFVESLKLDDGTAISLPADANDRAITGASSGGIAAFVAAWERPDLFSRVYSAVGTFVSMRGGNEIPALVRKYESKPLRIFLQDGTQDAWNPLFGTWWEYNQLLASALTFSGYDASWKWDEGGHSITYGTKVFPEAMEFLWRGWPARVEAGHSENDMLADVLVAGEGWEKVETAEQMPEGPLRAEYPDGSFVVWPEQGSNWLVSAIVSEDGAWEHAEQFYWLHSRNIGGANPARAMLFDAAGNLYVATGMGIQICDQNGRVRAILTNPTDSEGTVEVSSMKLSEDGVLYVSDGRRTFARKIGTGAPVPGTRPVSQGQG